MNVNMASSEVASFFEKAAGCFSTGLVESLKSRGHDFLEADSQGAFLYDSAGNRYIDCFTAGASCNLGRKNPELLKALEAASLEADQGVFLMISAQKAELASKLSAFMPGHLDCSLMQVVRGEAFDAACKLARGYTGRAKLVSIDGGWHGETGFAINLSQRPDKGQFGPPMPEVHTIPAGDTPALESVVDKYTAAVILETVQAENHCRIIDKDYVKTIRRLSTEHDCLLIVDETQTGFGRTGKKFSFEHFDIQPDIVILGEAVTGGVFPMSGIVFTPEVKQFFEDHPLIHLNTFGGHDVGCLVATKALDIYDRLTPWKNAAEKGAYLFTGLTDIQKQFPEMVESVAGLGLLLSIRFSSPGSVLEFCAIAKEQGMFAIPGKVDRQSIVLRPSLLLSKKEADSIVECVSKTMAALSITYRT